MNGVITCSVKEAAELIEHLNEDDMITLTIIDKKSHIIHSQPKRIKKKNGEKLIEKIDIVCEKSVKRKGIIEYSLMMLNELIH